MKKTAIYLFVTFIVLSIICTMNQTALSQTDQAQDVKVVSYSYYIDNLGYLDVVGEVQNTGQDTLTNVQVGCTILGVDGEKLDERGWYIFSPVLLPQQKASFYLQFPNINPTESSYFDWTTKGVTSFEFSTSSTVSPKYQYPNLTIKDVSSSIGNTADDKGVFWITCSVQNTGDQTAKNVTVIGTFYNSSGAVVAVGMSEYKNPPALSPSDTKSFKLGAWDRNQTTIPQSDKIATYSLALQVLEPAMSGSAAAVTPAPTYVAASGNNWSTDGGLSTDAIIGIVVVVVLVIAGAFLALRIRKRKGSTQETKKPVAKPTKKPQAKPKHRR
jgi:hypothetical protein